ncbi:MAG: hypothetical protein MMC23_005605 [Stictis urceolatum]|nr:hypothetical protein [Stictis urceolata]
MPASTSTSTSPTSLTISGHSFTPLLSTPLSALLSNPPTLYSLLSSPPATYRYLHIPPLITPNPTLILLSTATLPPSYAALSYPWSALPSPPTPTIQIEGLDPKDSLSASMLIEMCSIAHAQGCEFLWMDKLCVRQDKGAEKTDKPWQVKRMFGIYEGCKVCLVAPGGMGRFPGLRGRTTWIDRAWTLQEALAPRDVRVLLQWEGGDGGLQHNSFCEVEQVRPGVGMAPLRGLLEASLKSEVRVLLEDRGADSEAGTGERVGVFLGEGETQFAVMALLGAMDLRGSEGWLNAVWRCLIMRSAKFREDLIFSSMGLMGVKVDGKGVKEENGFDDEQVSKLLVRLLKELIRKGEKAEWLGLAPGLRPAKGHSALPPLPLKSNVGGGFVENKKGNYVEIKANMDANGTMDSWWWLKDAPKGECNDDGDFTFRAKAVPVKESSDKTEYTGYILQRDTPRRLVNCSTHRAWDILDGAKDVKSYAVVVGKKELYTIGIFGTMVDPTTTLLMLVDEQDGGAFCNSGYAWGDENIAGEWTEKEFTVGG